MNATDELRAELTKRGIEWRWEDERTTYWYVTIDGEEWGEWTAIEMGGYLHLSFSSEDVLNPAQAIAATLGAGACHLEEIEKDCDNASEYMLNREWCFDAVYRCSCGCCFGHVAHNRPRYCPNCGRKVVDQ